MSDGKRIKYDFMRKLSPNTKLHKDHWESTVVISWKDRAYLPKALGDGKNSCCYKQLSRAPANSLILAGTLTSTAEAVTLCTLHSDTSGLELRNFDKVSSPWLLGWGAKYFEAHYKVVVVIEVANILFEVWCNGRKLSKDEPIQVQWKEGAKMSKDIFVR